MDLTTLTDEELHDLLQEVEKEQKVRERMNEILKQATVLAKQFEQLSDDEAKFDDAVSKGRKKKEKPDNPVPPAPVDPTPPKDPKDPKPPKGPKNA